MSERSSLLLTPEERQYIRIANCWDDVTQAQVVFAAPEHEDLERNDWIIDLVERNYTVESPNERKDDLFIEGVQSGVRLNEVFSDGIEAIGWDDLEMIAETDKLFRCAETAYYLRADGLISKERYQRVYQAWLDSCIKRNKEKLVPHLQQSFKEKPEGRKFVVTGLGHVIYDASVGDQIQDDGRPKVRTTIETGLYDILKPVKFIVMRATEPKYMKPDQGLRQQPPSRRRR